MSRDYGINIKANDQATHILSKVGGALGLLSKEGLAVGASIVGVQMAVGAASSAFSSMQQYLHESIDTFYQFERSMAEVSTMMSEMEQSILPDMQKEIIGMSIAFGKSANDLSRAMYQTLSAGIDAKDAMYFLSEASELASAGITSVENSVDVLTTVLNAYGMSVNQVSRISDILFKTVELGKLRLDDLTNSLGYIIPIAAQAGVSFEQVASAIATMTQQGIDPQMASRSLRQTIVNLISPAEEAKQAFIDLGIPMDDLTLQSKGLQGTLEMIGNAVNGDVNALNSLIPNVRALSAVMALSGESSDIFNESLVEITNSAEAASIAFEKLQDKSFFKKEQMQSIREELKRQFGEATAEWDLFWEQKGAEWEAGGWKALLPIPIGFALAQSDVTAMYDNVNKAMGEYINKEQAKTSNEEINNFYGLMENLSTIGVEQLDIYERLGARISQYTQEIADLNNEIEKQGNIHGFTEAQRYIESSLKGTSQELATYGYLNRIAITNIKGFSGNITELVRNIRLQREELSKLNKVNEEYNQLTQDNNIRILELQINADKRRGRMTRNERKELEALQLANKEAQLAQMKNQTLITQKNDILNSQEERIESLKRMLAEEIYLTNDSYNTQIADLNKLIDFKELLIGEHESDMEVARNKSINAWLLYYNQLLLNTRTWTEQMRNYFKDVAGYTMGHGLNTAAQQINALGGNEFFNTISKTWAENGKFYVQSSSGTTKEFTLALGQTVEELSKIWWTGKPISFETGTDFVPKTGLYKLHQGEAVIPANQNNNSRNVNVNVNHNLTGTLHINMSRNLNSSDDPAEWVTKQIFDGLKRGLIRTDISTIFG